MAKKTGSNLAGKEVRSTSLPVPLDSIYFDEQGM